MTDSVTNPITETAGVDIDMDTLWVNILAQSLGINTLFSTPTDNLTETSFFKCSENIGGSLLGHPVLAKALMFNYITKSTPEVYSASVKNGISTDVVYMFKGWTWRPDAQVATPWFTYFKDESHDFPLEEWTKIHDMVMTRCLSTNVRDMFHHFGKMSEYGLFLTRLYEANAIPIEMIRNVQG
jgi:hypothetical protein